MILLIILFVICFYSLVATAPKRNVKATWKLIKFMIGLTFKIVKIPFSIIFYFMKQYSKKKKLEAIENAKLEKQKQKLQLKIKTLRGENQ